jgi:cell division protein ZapA (FtsZ GTPase activity inhibitor)
MGSQGTRFRDELAAQTIDTDIYKARLSNFLDTSFTNVRLVSKSIFIQSLMAMLQLNEHRTDVQAFSISKGEGIGFYTNMNMNFLGIVGLVARDANLGDIQQLMYSFLAYTHSKEKAGNERALGSTPFAKNEWNPSSYSKFVKVIAMQDTHDYFFETFSEPVNIKFRDDTMLQDKCVQVHQRMRQLALDNLDASVYAEYEGSMWFWNMTCKINLQRIVESHIAEELQSEAQSIVDSSTSGMIIVIVTLGAVLIMDGLTVMALAQAQATSQLEEFRQSLRSTDPEAVEEARVKTIEKFKKKLKTMNLVKNKRQRNQCGRYLRTIMIAIESMKNIKFLTQVYLSVFLSAVSLVVFSWLLLEDTIVHSRRAAQLWENMNLSFFLSNVVHETQKERGATGVHMNSAGVSFEKELPEQRLLTNVHARFLYQFLKNDFIDYMEIQNYQSVKNVMDGLAIINEHRLKVWNKEYTPPVGIGWYTSFNMKIISVMDDIAKDASGDNIEPRVLSYLGFMYAKEKAGNERAVGTLGLSAGKWPTTADLAKFTRIVNFQLAGMNYFNVFSNPESKRRYKVLLEIDPSEVKNPVVIANAYQQAMLDHNTTLMEMWNAADWFNNITLKINRLRVVEQTIAEDMREFFSRFNLDYWKKIVIVLAVLISMSLVTLSIMLKGFALVMRSNAFYSYKGRLERQLLKEEKKIKAQLEQGSDDSDDSEVDVADVKLN